MTTPTGSTGNNFDQFKADIDAAERKVGSEIEPGARALVVAILVFVLLATFFLPHSGDARGVDVLLGTDAATQAGISLPSRVFSWLAVVFGVGFSMLALMTRRWTLAWVASAGTAVSCVVGMLAIWSRQTAPDGFPGPGLGLVVAWLTVIVLAFHWVRVVWSRTAVQLAAEEHRRRAAAEQQSRSLLDQYKPDSGSDHTGPNHTDPGRDGTGSPKGPTA
ncbi:MAG: rane protein [Mycobacterium sp.]|nr:rane protein [Mycobacterium sp.]